MSSRMIQDAFLETDRSLQEEDRSQGVDGRDEVLELISPNIGNTALKPWDMVNDNLKSTTQVELYDLSFLSYPNDQKSFIPLIKAQ